MTKKERVSIIGAGAWGTTLAVLLNQKGMDVSLWVFEEELAETIREFGENKWYLPGFQVPSSINTTSKGSELAGSDCFIFAVPSTHITSTAKRFSGIIKSSDLVISATKGFEQKTLKRMSETLKDELKLENICALSGPNLSHEIANGLPAASVAASSSENTARQAQQILMTNKFRVYTNTDIAGVELGGALKNIIALACGAADGLGLGDNAKSALMVRGMTEIKRLGASLGARAETFAGLSGMGDLIATCSSKLSRNHRVGERLAKGEKLSSIMETMKETAEGIPTAAAAKKLAKQLGVEMPITMEVNSVLFEDKDPYKAISDLMTRSPKGEE